MTAADLSPGTIREVLENALFRVQLDDGRSLLAHLSPKLRRTSVRIIAGDRVAVRPSARDSSRGRIEGRLG